MKKYNYSKIRNEVREIVEKANYSKNNKYKSTFWNYHTLPVVELSLKLCKLFKADRGVVELSALLHDYSAIYNYEFAKEHHVHSARMAREILTKLKFPDEKIKHVASCILSHRGSHPMKKKTIEAKILASADAMSHFTQLADMMLLTYGIHKYETKEGAIWLKNKLKRSWAKIMPEGREMIREDRRIAIKILNIAINNNLH